MVEKYLNLQQSGQYRKNEATDNNNKKNNYTVTTTTTEQKRLEYLC